jgi:serine O-acetyltransferase
MLTGIRASIRADGYRYGDGLIRPLLRQPGFRYLCVFRLAQAASGRPWGRFSALPLRLLLSRMRILYDIPLTASVGPGLYLARHPGGIVVNDECRIGANCNLSQGVTLGQANRGPRAGAPRIGDRVYVGPGAKVLGAVSVGSDAAIGANAVVTRDVPDGAVVVGIPATVLSFATSAGYIERIWEP